MFSRAWSAVIQERIALKLSAKYKMYFLGLQVNFFDDHTKVILCPEGQDYLVTYINSHRQAVSYRLLQFRHFGCSTDISERLTYARKMLESIINIEGETV